MLEFRAIEHCLALYRARLGLQRPRAQVDNFVVNGLFFSPFFLDVWQIFLQLRNRL